MTVVGCPLSQPPGSASRPSVRNSFSIPRLWSDARAEPVGREQVDPGQHPHQVVDPQRQDQAEQDDAPPASRVARREVRHRVADEQRQPDRDDHELDRAQRDGQELPAVPDVLQHLEHVADVPVQRVPERDGLRERVLVAEGDGQDRVEGDEEEDGQPRDARQREQPPRPARAAHQPTLNFDQASSQKRCPSTLSCRSSWLAANWSGRTTACSSDFGISPASGAPPRRCSSAAGCSR